MKKSFVTFQCPLRRAWVLWDNMEIHKKPVLTSSFYALRRAWVLRGVDHWLLVPGNPKHVSVAL